MPARPRRYRPIKRLTLDPAWLRRAEALAEASGLPVSRIVDGALEAYLPGRIAALPPDHRAAVEAALAEAAA